ncbi:CP family cyanate transporter-like MFS transporter [Stackebrandtia endophytica]|uniref:CP family cyanate transporter-like MFS transporter n=1 Tax=Stackebrandtia endophytica TaxID=1496996 RepID=A0A543B435_9ACTN|nr:MFS transporter [Stackebrandtia endophytica]TQL79595.1 CP family cyanate transporter-like MFS transporter [Stackebrandtia endophytica]
MTATHDSARRTAKRLPATPMAGLIISGVLLAALNLRTAVTSVGPVLSEIQDGLGMSAAIAGVLTTLPVICFAVMGGVTPALVRRFGDRAVLLVALGATATGLILRAGIESVPVFLLASTAALAGGAIGNVAIPTIVKHHFPDRVGALTMTYSTSLALGSMLAASFTVPLEQLAGGSWQWALGLWAVPAIIAMVPWLFLTTRGDARRRATGANKPIRGITRSKLGWMMLIAFGSQSLIAYVMFGWLPEIMRDHGFSAAQAGVMLGVFTAIGVPVALITPILATRRPNQRALMVFLVSGYFVGMPALWLGGQSWVSWAGLVFTAISMGTFPLMLTLFVLRTRTAGGTAALSAFAQSGGYLMSGVGPILVGVLYEVTGDWTAPFCILLGSAVVHLFSSWTTTSDRYLEDELAAKAG